MDEPLFESDRHARYAGQWLLIGVLASGAAWYNYATGALLVLLLLLASLALAWSAWRLTSQRMWWVAPVLAGIVMVAAYIGPWAGYRRLLLLPLLSGGVAASILTVRGRALTWWRAQPVAAGMLGLALVIGASGAVGAWRGGSREPMPAELAALRGCYMVDRGMLFPLWAGGEWPPLRVRLDTARWTEGMRRDGPTSHVGTVYLGARMLRSRETSGFWRTRSAGGLTVEWSHRGHVGFQGVVFPDGPDLVGQGEWFQDMFSLIPTQRQDLTFRRIRCDLGFPE